MTPYFWEAADVSRHVNACTITGVGTGSSGTFRLHFFGGRLDYPALEKAEFKVRLGLEVRDQAVCVRDLYDLMSWDPICPSEQVLSLPNGFYRITAYSSTPASGLLGDDQDIYFHLHEWTTRPVIVHKGVPRLC